jgi:hypothetical protein
MEDFLENIYVYLPILAIVLIRLLGSAGKRNKARRPPAVIPEPAFDSGEAPAFPQSSPRQGGPAQSGRYALSGTPPPPPSPSLPAPGLRGLPEASPGRPAPKRGVGFPGMALPALQQAAVWAELLGPPKGL